MQQPGLFMILLGCKPQGRNTEQHDIFFAIGNTLKEVIPQIEAFWPGAGRIHIDAWRQVTSVDGYNLRVVDRNESVSPHQVKLFFLNLGGYKQNEFEEFHYKVLTIANSKAEAINKAKESAFFKHMGFPGAVSHIDDKYGLDVDDVFEIEEILPGSLKKNFQVIIEENTSQPADEIHLGYLKLTSL